MIKCKNATQTLWNEFWVEIMQKDLKGFFRDLVESKTFVLEFVGMKKYLVEIFTKIFVFNRFDSLRKTLGI